MIKKCYICEKRREAKYKFNGVYACAQHKPSDYGYYNYTFV